VLHLVELHGGSIYVDSDGAGRGNFTLKLLLLGRREISEQREGRVPWDKRAQGEQGENSPLPLTGLQVLVVDDDSDTRDFTTVLEQH